MEFLNPAMLWGALAVSLPILLHFWHQKRGKELAWAASRWLTGRVLQKSRGVRLENILLLVLRCLMLLLLVFWLSEPLFRRFLTREEKVHWIEPRREVVENFRFELEEAAKKGEKRFWFNGEPVTELTLLPRDRLVDLQLGINTVKAGGAAEIYLSGTGDFTHFARVYLPGPYRLHRMKRDLEVVSDGKVPSGVFAAQIESGKPLKVLVDGTQGLAEGESETIRAALNAIAEVHGVFSEVDEQRVPGRAYDVVFSHRPDSSALLSVVSGAADLSAEQVADDDRVLWFRELLKPEASEAVFSGELPETLLEALMKGRVQAVLSEQQLRNKFGVRPPDSAESLFNSLILVLFVLVVAAERWLAIQKNS